MKIIYNKSESTIRPIKIDTTSSNKIVYLRKNILEKQREFDGNIQFYYEYDEAKLTKSQYEEYIKELNSESIHNFVEELESKTNELVQENKSLSEQIDLLTDCLLEISQSVYK